MNCTLCGGDAGSFSERGNHYLCEARDNLGLDTPSLGKRCVHCKGVGRIPRTGVGPMLSFDLGPTSISNAIEAWAPSCTECDGTGLQ